MVLFGLKFGMVDQMIYQLIEDPKNREIRPASSGHYDTDWFATLKRRADIEFLVPHTRSIAASIKLKSKTARRIIDVELIPTAENDPLLPNLVDLPTGYASVVLSKTAAQKLKVEAGDFVKGSVFRQYQGEKQQVLLGLTVTAIASSGGFERAGAFASIKLLDAVEDYRDGHEVPKLGWKGSPSRESHIYTGFRLFTRSIYDVAELKRWFNEQGIEVRTRASGIETVQRLDRNLSLIYWLIALIGLIGFVISLSASLWANINSKRIELSVLRVVGFGTLDIIWFPIAQSLLTAIFGWWLAVNIFFVASLLINDEITIQLQPGYVCYLLPIHYLMTLALTCGLALFTALIAGFRSARIEPADGLREI